MATACRLRTLRVRLALCRRRPLLLARPLLTRVLACPLIRLILLCRLLVLGVLLRTGLLDTLTLSRVLDRHVRNRGRSTVSEVMVLALPFAFKEIELA